MVCTCIGAYVLYKCTYVYNTGFIWSLHVSKNYICGFEVLSLVNIKVTVLCCNAVEFVRD